MKFSQQNTKPSLNLLLRAARCTVICFYDAPLVARAPWFVWGSPVHVFSPQSSVVHGWQYRIIYCYVSREDQLALGKLDTHTPSLSLYMPWPRLSAFVELKKVRSHDRFARRYVFCVLGKVIFQRKLGMTRSVDVKGIWQYLLRRSPACLRFHRVLMRKGLKKQLKRRIELWPGEELRLEASPPAAPSFLPPVLPQPTLVSDTSRGH